MTRLIVRTVKHGQVTIGGTQYRPPDYHLKYDGRLEKTKLVFRIYPDIEEVAYLWGTLDAYRSDATKMPTDDITCVDGKLPWVCWEVVREDKQ